MGQEWLSQIQDDPDFWAAPPDKQQAYLHSVISKQDAQYSKSAPEKQRAYIQKAIVPKLGISGGISTTQPAAQASPMPSEAVAVRPTNPVVSNRPEAPSNTNFFGDLINHANNAAKGYQQDALLKKSGQGVGSFSGDVAGGFVPIVTGAATGAGLGSIIPGAGTAGGALYGGISAAGLAGGAQDLQAQRLEGMQAPGTTTPGPPAGIFVGHRA